MTRRDFKRAIIAGALMALGLALLPFIGGILV
jgi:hypothetical protein